MEMEIENIHEAWELKRALKRTIEEKNQTIKNLRLEEITMKEVGMSRDAIDASITKRITSLERDKKTCIKIIRKLNVYVYPEEGVLC